MKQLTPSTRFSNRLTFLFIVVIMFSALRCRIRERYQYQDEFYNKAGGWDYKQLPLVKPYFLMSTGNVRGLWYCNLVTHDLNELLNQTTAEKFFVNDRLILLYTWDQYSERSPLNRAHYILIDLKNRHEYSFKNKEDIKRYLPNEDPALITLQDIEPFYEKYRETGKLPWYNEH